MARSAPPAVRLPESREKIQFSPQNRHTNRPKHAPDQIVRHAEQGLPSRETKLRAEGGSREVWCGHYTPAILENWFTIYVVIINSFFLFDNNNLSSVAKTDIWAGPQEVARSSRTAPTGCASHGGTAVNFCGLF